jgi:hypothetical protein
VRRVLHDDDAEIVSAREVGREGQIAVLDPGAAAAPRRVARGVFHGVEHRVDRCSASRAGGRSEKQVADDLHLSPHTVHEYVKALYRHFGVQSRSELLALCLANRES